MPLLATPATRSVVLSLPRDWTPLDLGSGLLGWYEADSLALADGTAVSSWTDLSGNGRNADQGTGGSQPALKTFQLNGRSAIRFDATDDSLVTANMSPGILGGDFAMAVVYKVPPSVPADRSIITLVTTANRPNMIMKSTRRIDGVFTGDTIFTTVLTASTWYTLIMARTGTEWALWINGTKDATTNTKSGSITDGFGLIIGGSGFGVANADIAAALFYKGTIDRTSLEAYWRARYAHY